MLSEGVVGPQVLSDGSFQDIRLGPSGELVTTGLHGKYYEQNYRGNLFRAVTPPGASGLVIDGENNLNGLVIYNPFGSGKLVSIVKTVLCLTVQPTTNQVAGAIAYYYAEGATVASSTPLTPATGISSCVLGSGAQPVAQLLSGGTSSPITQMLFPIVSKTGGSNPSPSNSTIVDYPEGSIVLLPGSLLAIQETTQDVGATDNRFSRQTGIMWEEVPM